MWARRFLITILVLTLLAVGGAFALFQFGQHVLIRQATPQGRFEAAAVQAGPDYAVPASWIAGNGNSDNPSSWVPEGFSPGTDAQTGRAAIFFIHPTTYLRTDRWNGLVDDPESASRARLFVQSQASAFAGSGEVWAPKYRQAAYGAFLLDSQDAQQALGLAYADVLAAFDRFLAQAGPDRPIILAGHSQGALHLTRLLRDRVAGKPLRSRIVAAYVVGWPISIAADVPALGLPGCTQPAQAGCILSWLTFGEPANPDLVLAAYEGSAGFAGGKRRRDDVLCVNPLTGTRDGTAPPSANPGTLVPTADLSSASLAVGRVGARCDRGLLVIAGDIPRLGPFVLPGNNYHVYDYALFWAAVRADADRRVAAWTR